MSERIIDEIDEEKIEAAWITIRFGVMGVGGCHAVGGSTIGVKRGQTVNRDALENANIVIKNADPATLEKVQKTLERKQYPTGADYAGVI